LASFFSFTMALLIQTILALTVIFSALLGIFVYTGKNRLLQRSLLGLYFLGITGWAYSTLVVLNHESLMAVKTAYASATLLITAKFYFILTFPNNKLPRHPAVFLPAIVASSIFILSFFAEVFFTDFSVVKHTYVLVVDGPYAYLYMITVFLLLIYPIINLYTKLKSNQYAGYITEQIRFLLLGVSLFFLIGFATNSVLPVVFAVYHFNGTGPSLSLILAALILYIINKHHFLDLSIVIQRGFIYSVLLSAIAGFYLVTLFVLNNISQSATSINPALSGLVTAILGIFSVPRLDTYLRKKTDRFFFKDSYDYTEVLQRLSEMLNRSIEIEQIKSWTKQSLQQVLKASSVRIEVAAEPIHLTTTKPRPTTTYDKPDTLNLPLISNQCLIGRIFLDQKLSGDRYTTADLQLLETLSHHIALACERALLHKQLQDYSKDLEKKVKQRTLELQAAYEGQQTMISNIAHGLQTPLTIISNEIDTLKESQTLQKNSWVLERSLASISTFIYDLLHLAQLESRTEVLELELFDLSDLLSEVTTYTGLMAAEKDISIHPNVTDDTWIKGDPKRIEEVLIILISNAIKYMRSSNHQRIDLGLHTTADYIIITVSDSGIGIPATMLSKIFDRFYRVKDTQSKDVPGSGLGLAIARTIIQKHQGTIAVSSTPGVGTTFTITLPRHITLAEQAKQANFLL
jgi:signal transduction histidine kinase